MNFRDPFDRGGGGPANWPTLKGVVRPKPIQDIGSDPEPMDMSGPEPVTEKFEVKPQAVLKKLGWVNLETEFNTDAEIFAEFEIPESEKHRTLVDFQLWRNRDGEYVIEERVQGHLDSQGRATAKVAIRKENAPEAFFALKARHGSGAFADKPAAERAVTETAEITCAHTQVSGLHFPRDRSFIGDTYLDVLGEVKRTYLKWKEAHPKAQILVFGHSEADQDGEAHHLSKARAKSAFLFLIGDVDGWAELAEKEQWGCWEQQCMLRALGFFHVKPNGIRGPKTRKATDEFIHFLNRKRGKKFNPLLGLTEAYIRKELYREYMNHKRDEWSLPSSVFRLVSGFPFVGCSGFNRYLDGEGLHAENRRVVFVMLEESRNFPLVFPCRSGTIGPCEDQVNRLGERAIPGFRCKFYDEMVSMEKVGTTAASGNAHEIETHWRGLPRQNDFNDDICSAAAKYDLDPLVLKSLIAQESSFDSKARNEMGFAGLTQVGGRAIEEAGLDIGTTAKVKGKWVYDLKGDERLDAKKSIEAGAHILSIKRTRVDHFIISKFKHPPTDEEKWKFYLAAYNGGEGVIRAAWQGHGSVDCTWEDLIKPGSDGEKPALYKAIPDSYGDIDRKFEEISAYPVKIMNRKNS